MRKIAAFFIGFAAMFWTEQAVIAAETAGNPAYISQARMDEEGLTDNYTYTFAGGVKDTVKGEFMLLVNGTFAPETNIIVQNDRTLVPVRFIAEAFGAEVKWDEKESAVTIQDGNSLILMKIGQGKALVNGKELALDTPPVIEGGATYVPVRFVSEGLHKAVGFLPAASAVKSLEFYNLVPSQIGIAYNPILWIDEPSKMNTIDSSTEELLEELKSAMLEGYAALRENTKAASGERILPFYDDTLEKWFDIMENQIAGMTYIGQVGRYALFGGPYITLADASADAVYFYYYGHAVGALKQVDMRDSQSYIPMYFAD